MTKNDDVEKVARFQAALDQLIERIAEDRYVLAIVLVGSLSPETIWHRETLGLWIIEADGVSRRLPSDGKDERVFRILVENGINIHAEVIPRSRFKKMVEGASRTAFSCNFFAERQVVYSKDPSIDTLVQGGQQRRDQGPGAGTLERSRRGPSTAAPTRPASAWTSRATSSWRRRKSWGPPTAWPTPRSSARARCGNRTSSTARLKGTRICFRRSISTCWPVQESARPVDGLDAIDGYLDTHYRAHLKPLLDYLKKQNRVVPLSEMSDHFAFSQVHPWHLESACEWLDAKDCWKKSPPPSS